MVVWINRIATGNKSKCSLCGIPHEKVVNVNDKNEIVAEHTGRFMPIYTLLYRCMACGRYFCKECLEYKEYINLIEDGESGEELKIFICKECDFDRTIPVRNFIRELKNWKKENRRLQKMSKNLKESYLRIQSNSSKLIKEK